MRSVRGVALKVLLVCCVGLFSGCGSSFKYRPKHDQTYPLAAIQPGAEITKAEDLRPEDERQPEWSRRVEVIVANAVADELKYSRVFQRVKIHLSGPVAINRYSDLIEVKIKKFRYYNPASMADYGREALGWLGIRGALIARSIPRQYISEVEIEFQVRSAYTGQILLDKTYSDTRTLTTNGYEGASRATQQTSDALENVVKQFVADLAQSR